MTTIVNTPPSGEKSDSGLGIIFGVIIGIGLVVLFFVYGLPAIRQGNKSTTTITVPGPTGATGATGATGNTGATGATGSTTIIR